MPAMSIKQAEDQITRLFDFFAESSAGPESLREYRDWLRDLDIPMDTARALVTLATRRFQWLPKPVMMEPLLDEIRGDQSFVALKERIRQTCVQALGQRRAHDGREEGWTLRKILVGHRAVCVEERDASWQDRDVWDQRIRAVDALIVEIDARREGVPRPTQAALAAEAGNG